MVLSLRGFKMSVAKQIFILVVVAGISFSIGKFLTPPSVKEKIVYRENTSVKVNSDRTLDKIKTIKPDGTQTIEWRIHTKKTSEKTSEVTLDKEKTMEQRKNWMVFVTYQPSLVTIQSQNVTIGIQKRLFSEIYVGGSISTDRTFGVTIGVGF